MDGVRAVNFSDNLVKCFFIEMKELCNKFLLIPKHIL